MPKGVKTGDWLRTTETSNNRTVAEEDEDKKDGITHFRYALRPVACDAAAQFQLVGKTNGLQSISFRMNTKKTRSDNGFWQADFIFI